MKLASLEVITEQARSDYQEPIWNAQQLEDVNECITPVSPLDALNTVLHPNFALSTTTVIYGLRTYTVIPSEQSASVISQTPSTRLLYGRGRA